MSLCQNAEGSELLLHIGGTKLHLHKCFGTFDIPSHAMHWSCLLGGCQLAATSGCSKGTGFKFEFNPLGPWDAGAPGMRGTRYMDEAEPSSSTLLANASKGYTFLKRKP